MRAAEHDLDILPHALAIGIDKNALVSNPAYPATLEDYDGYSTYKGVNGQSFAMGSLLMLPTSFNAEALKWPETRAMARTLKLRGGYIVDATGKTLNFYAEIGSPWSKSSVDGKWQNSFADDLAAIKRELRRVVKVDGWKDSNGVAFTPTPFKNMNLLCMRGPWSTSNGKTTMVGAYNAIQDLFVCDATTETTSIRELLYTQNEAAPLRVFNWQQQAWYLNPEPGAEYIVRAVGSGNISASINIKSSDFKTQLGGSKSLRPGEQTTIVWPNVTSSATEVFINKPSGSGASIRLELVKV